MSVDQATELRRLMSRLKEEKPAGAARVVAVTSGKGGVGKTNVAVNLSARLSKMGRRVALLDADMGMANADVICNATATVTLAHVVAGRKQLADAMLEGPGGFTLVPGASGLAQMANLSEFERARVVSLFRQLESDYDMLLIDTGAGIGPNVMSFLLAADDLLVITTPEPTAITDAYALVKAVSRQRESIPVNLFVNQVQDSTEAKAVFERVSAVCRRFLGLSLIDAGHMVSDPRVTASVRRRRPFVLDSPDAPASLCVRQLAHKLDRDAAEPDNRGFFRRVASWLAG